ncbi:hypothetical protein D3C86_1606320 [compost metagenome]
MTAAHQRQVDRTEGLLDGALGTDGAGPDRKAHLTQGVGIAHTGIDHQGTYAMGLERSGKQVAEVTVGARRAGGNHQNIPGAALLHRHMEHPVVARCNQHRDRRAADGRPPLNRCDRRRQQAFSPLGLVNGRDTEAPQFIDQRLPGPCDVAHDDAGFSDQLAHARFSVTRGKMLW